MPPWAGVGVRVEWAHGGDTHQALCGGGGVWYGGGTGRHVGMNG